jgi:predicted RNase H-like HicB family nuclease
MVAEPSLAPPAPQESPRLEPTPAPPVREPAPVAPEPAPLDLGTERARELGAQLEAASNQLIEVYKQYLDQKDERGESLTDADEELEEWIEEVIAAAERLNRQIRINLDRLREKRQTPQGRADLRNRALKMKANIQKVEALMNEVQPGPEVEKVWRQVTGLWRQVARAAAV